jgi:hypothetical protein
VAQLFSLGVMHIAVSILLFAASVTFTILLLGNAVAGIKRREVYYDPASPPISFRSRPIAFVALCAVYIALGVCFSFATVASALRLFKTL